MAFYPPTFNATCNVWRSGVAITSPPSLVLSCQLRMWRNLFALTVGGQWGLMLLICPKGSDLRPFGSTSGADVVEVPAGLKRYYSVVAVDDMAKGFPNEYRIGLLQPGYSIWHLPIN